MTTDAANSGWKNAGLFAYLNEAKIYDLSIHSSCTFSFAPNASIMAGGFAARSSNSTFINCSNFANITVNNSGVTTNNVGIRLGGFVGESSNNTAFYLSTFTELLRLLPVTGLLKTARTALTYTDNTVVIGGFIGRIVYSGTPTITADGCYSNTTISATHGGICATPFIGLGRLLGFNHKIFLIPLLNLQVTPS